MSNKEILEDLLIRYDSYYHQCPEGETQEGYEKRKDKGMKVFNAIGVIKKDLLKITE